MEAAPGPGSPTGGRISDAALENLVRQFARPLDCLRELVQNSIDAGSPRIEVTLGWKPEDATTGVLSIAVQDFGEGMDEHVIDHELTRMFASSKAGDESKIGRFGIGFTSVFAIAPELVHVVTGRHGAGWELVFHADRSIDKLALDRPPKGTRVTLFKRIPTFRRGEWQRDIEDALRFWCAHSQVPVRLDDGALVDPEPPAAPSSASPRPSADPFAAFEAPVPVRGRTITRALDLPDARFTVHRVEGEIEVWAGLGKSPVYRWYNGGLTLLSTTDPACLGDHDQHLAHLRFKAQYRCLEHTLTRDNVIQDDAWQAVVTVLERAARDVLAKVLAAHQQAANDGAPLGPTLAALATIGGHTGSLPRRPALTVPRLHGPPIGLPDAFELATRPTPLTAALHDAGHVVLHDTRELRTVARSLGHTLPADVADRWVLVEVDGIAAPVLDPAVRDLLEQAGVPSLTVRWCHIHGREAPFAIAKPPTGRPMRRDQLQASLLGRLLGVQSVWVNVAHPNVKLATQVGRLRPRVAAFAVLQVVFAMWDGTGSRRFRAICQAVKP